MADTDIPTITIPLTEFTTMVVDEAAMADRQMKAFAELLGACPPGTKLTAALFLDLLEVVRLHLDNAASGWQQLTAGL